jgi:hypothetical protein
VTEIAVVWVFVVPLENGLEIMALHGKSAAI